jgi:acyl-CoA reductase-like NAD-dependent aldehyde dehydrogenase
LIQGIADKIDAHADGLAKISCARQGKPFFLVQMKVQGSIAWTRNTADLKIPVADTEHKRIENQRKPLGVSGSITPWNWPLMIAIWHIILALGSGNTVVNKPSSLTPLSTLHLIELINQVLPTGVVNSVTGEASIGNAKSLHPDIQKIAFTGSTCTGQKIMSNAANNLKRLTPQLAGNDAATVLPDSDIDAINPALYRQLFSIWVRLVSV